MGIASYWQDNPPLHLMVKAYLGIESAPRVEQQDEGTLDELMAMFGAAGGQVIHVEKG